MESNPFKPLAEILSEPSHNLTLLLTDIEVRRTGGGEEIKQHEFVYGGRGSYVDTHGRTIDGIRVFHERVFRGALYSGALNTTSHLGNPRRDEEKGILLTFEPSWEGFTFFYRILERPPQGPALGHDHPVFLD